MKSNLVWVHQKGIENTELDTIDSKVHPSFHSILAWITRDLHSKATQRPSTVLVDETKRQVESEK